MAIDGTSHETWASITQLRCSRFRKTRYNEYYSGKVNGIKTIENKGTDRNCFGNLKFYGVGGTVVTEPTPDTEQ